jgi:ABC-2 type transport system permease protein
MSASVLRSFVLKDLYFSRWIVAASFVVALLAYGLAAVGGTFAAFILLFCAGAAPATFLCLFLISGERKERSHLFALSLPISPERYLLAKVLALSSAYILPWAALGLITLLLAFVLPHHMGIVPYATLTWLFVLDQYAMMLAVTVSSRSEAAAVVAMIVFNISPAFFFYYMSRVASIGGVNPTAAVAVWSPVAMIITAIEILVALLLFAVVFWSVFHQKDQT